jgi:receptor protein-tyrosine kinase
VIDEPRSSQQSFEFLRIVWKRKLMVGWITVLGIVVAVGLSARQAKEYSSTAQLLFRDPGFQGLIGNGNGTGATGSDPQRDTQTSINVVTSSSVANRARAILKSAVSIDDLQSSITVEPDSNSDVVNITAKWGSPVAAARIANAFAQGYIQYRVETDRRALRQAETQVRDALKTATATNRPGLQQNLQQLQQLDVTTTAKAEAIGRAEPSATPVSPKPKRNAILGGAVALLLGSGLALLLDLLDKRLRTAEDFERAYPDYPVLAMMPATRASGPFDAHLHGPTAEAYRMLREGLRFIDPSGLTQCFLVVSAVESEGKSTVAVNLATSLSAVGQRVILIEADMRRPTAAATLKVSRTMPGLSNLLVVDDDIRDYLVDVDDDRALRVLSSGTVPPNPSDLLRQPRMPQILARARELADVVIIDAPPLLPVSDTHVLLQLDEIDGVIVVGRVGVSRRDYAAAASRILDHSGRRVFGLAVTGAAAPAASSYYDVAPPETSGGSRRAKA